MSFPKDSAFGQEDEHRSRGRGLTFLRPNVKVPENERTAATDPEVMYQELNQIAGLLEDLAGRSVSANEAHQRLLDLRDDVYRTLR